MRSLDKRRSRVVRYSGTTKTKIIETDSQGKQLFSVGERYVLKLADNKNGDICVSDFAGKNVVVVDVCVNLQVQGQYHETYTLQAVSALPYPYK